MEAKSPFEEIFESRHKDTGKQEEFLNGEDTILSKYLNLIMELIKKKYYFEAIEIIKELAFANIE